MINYIYWIAIALIIGLVAIATLKTRLWKTGLITSMAILLLAWLLFYFKFEQMWVKKYGGSMTISVPNGQIHLGITWKDDHLWVENFDPKTNTCYFSEYAKGHVLQGTVIIKHCNPALPSANPEAQEPIKETPETPANN